MNKKFNSLSFIASNKRPNTFNSKLKMAGLSFVVTTCASISAHAHDLEEVSVSSKQIDLHSETGSRLNLSIMETPATVEIISGDEIRERLDTSVLEAVTRVSGFTNAGTPGNGGQSITARGFSGTGAVTKLFDGTNYYTAAGTITFPFDTWGVERIDVLKGPSSVLYGEGGIGGAYNVIPKKPSQESGGHIRLTLGEDNTHFVGIDLTGGLSDTLAYRVNYSNSQSDNWVVNGESEAEMISTALLWTPSENLSITARYDYGDQQPMKYFGTIVQDGDFHPDFVESNFNIGDAEISYTDQSFRLTADWALSESQSLKAEVYHLDTDRYWKNAEAYYYDDSTELVSRFDPLIIGHDMQHDGLRLNFTSANTLAGYALRSSIGFEANSLDFERPSNFGPANSNPIDWSNDFDIVDPYNFDAGSYADLTDANVLLDNISDVKQMAIFGESQLKLNEKLAIVAGLRYEDIQTDYTRIGQTPIDQSVDALTGRLGIVYDVNESTALYGQYATGATHPSSSIVTASASNRESDMITSEQFEIGIKQQALNDRLTWNIAVFDIVKNDLIEDDPDSGNPEDKIYIDEQTSQGIEVGFDFLASNSFIINGNAVALNAETDTGETPTGVPEKTANLGFIWSANSQIKFIADARYVGERYYSSAPLPSYTVIDASAKYTVNHHLDLSLRIDNITDELYASASYSGKWLVGKPRTLSLTADYRF
jgi:iron complex outermembrane receptor protein